MTTRGCVTEASKRTSNPIAQVDLITHMSIMDNAKDRSYAQGASVPIDSS